jgi:hypothetical protein
VLQKKKRICPHCVLIFLISYVYSEVKTYNIGADSTLPRVPKKRKFENDTDEEDVKPKIPKTELTGNDNIVV